MVQRRTNWKSEDRDESHNSNVRIGHLLALLGTPVGSSAVIVGACEKTERQDEIEWADEPKSSP